MTIGYNELDAVSRSCWMGVMMKSPKAKDYKKSTKHSRQLKIYR